MSADLFAAFGQPDTASQPTTAASDANLSTTRPVKAQQVALLETDFDSRDPTPQPSFLEAWRPPALETTNSDAEVLFDATTEQPSDSNSEDEWGDFESAEQPPSSRDNGSFALQDPIFDISHGTESTTQLKPASHQVARPQPQLHDVIDLLSIDDDPPRATASYSTGDQPVQHPMNRAPSVDLATSHPAQEDEAEEDDWGEFIDGAEDAGTNIQQPIPTMSRPSLAKTASHSLPTKSETKSGTEKMEAPKADTALPTKDHPVRPTNIPPPSILLPLFPPLLEQSRRKAATLAKSKPDHEFANQLISNIKAMAHVVSGRQLRWKRDQILSQSTKIGPARSGRSGGMKLSSVNKSENVKEEKEAVEVLEAWKKCSGILNSVIASTGSRPMPPMSLHMQVRTATADEGALRSTHACALCGLKREERIPRVDDDASDSFGEWWLDHWGHADCEAFWKFNAAKLDHR
ncbi:uncharacterized protein GIQ15_01138 [Arthroderma uncinatum]|uniref:uncharacterized protein n=1 Tax=Arthroderma uncinatum TaxID=74035 RepID=UPI00144A912B|nr:uncharacterized protein GIQ15_01138 [Arthroderma uncinatum]KAF3491621.1 hypothetical protein GIQ15_01138 [Arthroderma uncinatum]